MTRNDEIKQLIKKAQSVAQGKKLDLSSNEDLSIAIMNLISLEEHLFFTAQKTGKKDYLTLLEQIRNMRKELMQKIIKDYEGEVWCVSKHLLAASMRLMEVGTKELGKGNKEQAWKLFEKSYQLYSLFWGINLNIVDLKDIERDDSEINLLSEKTNKKTSPLSVFDKLGLLVKKAIDCCRE